MHDHHELIKVKVAGADRETKQLIIDGYVRETKAAQKSTNYRAYFGALSPKRRSKN